MTVRRLDDRYANGTRPHDSPGLVSGSLMANLLRTVTQLAVGADERPTVRVVPTRGEPLVIEQADAAGLLPTP